MIQLNPPRVYADFNNVDAKGRVRLNCVGTERDLAQQQFALHGGALLTLYESDADAADRPHELSARGVVEYSAGEQIWVAAVDWESIRPAPGEKAEQPWPPAPAAPSAQPDAEPAGPVRGAIVTHSTPPARPT